jgi:hypothetical protein
MKHNACWFTIACSYSFTPVLKPTANKKACLTHSCLETAKPDFIFDYPIADLFVTSIHQLKT